MSIDVIKPWQYRSWIFPRDPNFVQKAGRALDLYHGFWNGKRLRLNDYVISSDEKPSFRSVILMVFTRLPVLADSRALNLNTNEPEALAYIAAWDDGKAKVFGLSAKSTGIEAQQIG